MKYLLPVLLLIGLTSSGQQVDKLTPSEIGYIFRTVPMYQAAGHNDTANIEVDKKLVEELKFEDLAIFKLTLTSNRKAVQSLKEQSSYRIGEKFRIWMKGSEIKCLWEYYGDNAYGAKKKSTILVTFDQKGTLKGFVNL